MSKEPKRYRCDGCGDAITVSGGAEECPRCGSRLKVIMSGTFREEAIQRDLTVLMDEIEGYLAALEEG